MYVNPSSLKTIKTHQVHNFVRKLQQRSTFSQLKSYVEWQKCIREGKKCPLPKHQAISINLDLTTSCNYYCDHCIDLGLINNGKRLKLETIKSLVSHWVEEGLRSVIVIGGGEPVLHPDFEDIIAFLKVKGLQVGIATNGSRVSTISKITFFLDKNDWIRFSLDAGRDETFQRIHNPKSDLSLDQILNDIKKMRHQYAGYQLGFSFLVLSHDQLANNKNMVDNISEIPLAARKAKENGFSYFSIKPFISPYPSRFTDMHKKYIEEIKKEVSRAKRLEDETFRVIESFNLLALFTNLNEKLRRQTKVCHVQFFRWVVTPDGIFNCPTWRGFAKAYLTDMERQFSKRYCQQLKRRLRECIENFNAIKECSKVSCIYNDFNWFVERIIQNPQKLKDLEVIGDYGDYFL